MNKTRTKPSTELFGLCTALQQQATNAATNNTRKDELYTKYMERKVKHDAIVSYESQIQLLSKNVLYRLSDYRNECIENLENRVEAILAVIFPEEQFKIKITYKLIRNVYQSELLIGKTQKNNTVKWGKPRARDGDFVKQLISTTMVASMNMLLGSDAMLLDEPFSSSDMRNVEKMKPVLELLLEDGVQLLIIEHKPGLYRDLIRQEVALVKHRHPTDEYKGFVEITRCEKVIPNDEDASEYNSTTAENT